MRLHIFKLFAGLLCFLAITSTACLGADLATVPTATRHTACQKADAMWNEKIIPSRYAQLPPLTGVGFFDLLKLANTSFSMKVLTSNSDELEEGRRKRVHAFGAEAQLRLVILPGAADSYSGIFKSGADCVIGRFSLANKPTAETSVPALALKIFIDGEHPSVNLQLMYSADGQEGLNFFAQPFSNILPPAQSYATRQLDRFFGEVAVEFGAKDPNPGRLTLEHVASTLPNGQPVTAPKTPYQLIFKPTAATQALMQGTTAEDDFRIKLATLPVGQTLYDIYTLPENEPAGNAKLLGQLMLASPVVSSRYGDEKLYFQHNMARN